MINAHRQSSKMAEVQEANNPQPSRVSPPTQTRRRSKLGFTSEKKIADDEFMAAAIGDTEWLRQSLRNNRGGINYDKSGLTSIHLAAIHGRLDCLRLLVDKFKMDVNISSTTGWRPIHLSISNQTGKRSFNCLTFLLTKAADPSIANEDGITPMHQAASEGHVQCLKALIEVGANIEGEDCQGHKPIDLAKLWGHKKCARILAAEMWHRDKDFVAKEMRQLQKVKMQQVLREIETDEEHRADQQFYGDMAFTQWVESRDLAQKPVGPPFLKPVAKDQEKTARPKGRKVKGQGNESKPVAEKVLEESGPRVDVLHRANSVQRPSRLSLIEEEGHGKPPDKASGRTLSPVSSGTVSGDEPTRRTPAVTIVEPVTEEQQPVSLNKKIAGYTNTHHWVNSPKVPPPEYVQLLPDYYPRDILTMLPKYPSVRGGLSRDTLDSLLAGSASQTTNESITTDTKLRIPKLPPDVIDKALNKASTKKERRVVFKCQNIIDVQQRKLFDPDQVEITRSEIGFHMTSDINSRAFQSGLQPQRIPTTPSTAISELSQTSFKSLSSRSATSLTSPA